MERGSYLLLEPGMPVRDADGADLGSVSEVVADEGLDIFRGIVLERGGMRDVNVFVPGEEVAAVDGGTVTLALKRDDIDRLERVPAAAAGQNRGMDFTPPSADL